MCVFKVVEENGDVVLEHWLVLSGARNGVFCSTDWHILEDTFSLFFFSREFCSVTLVIMGCVLQ